MKKFATVVLFFWSMSAFSQVSLQQQLVQTLNSGTNGGQYKVAVQVSGTNLTWDNTLKGCTIDVAYDNTKVSFPTTGGAINTATSWNAAFATAGVPYTRSTTNPSSTFVRVLITDANVGGNFDGTPSGFDLTTSNQTVVTLTFTIIDKTQSASFSIISGSNSISLFSIHSDSLQTGVGSGRTLSPTIGITNAPLPVELSSFTALAQGRTINLSWATKTEINNSGFDIERQAVSTTPSATSTWAKVGSVTGKGTTNAPQNYSFSDVVKAAGSYNYRLKQIDHNGNFTYSSEVTVKATLSPEDYKLSQNYPKPLNPSTKFNFAVKSTEHVAIKVYNSIGQEVASLFDGVVPADQIQEVTFDGSRLASGIYFYVLRATDRVEVKKMLMMK